MEKFKLAIDLEWAKKATDEQIMFVWPIVCYYQLFANK
jgi:hypothetical protein